MRLLRSARRLLGRISIVLFVVTSLAWWRSYKHEDVLSLGLGRDWHRNNGSGLRDRYLLVYSEQGRTGFVLNDAPGWCFWFGIPDLVHDPWPLVMQPFGGPVPDTSLQKRSALGFAVVWTDRSASPDLDPQWPYAYRALIVPDGYLVGIFSIPVVAILYRAVRAIARRRRIRRGLCGDCGYDLRASEGRCPECGAAFERASSRVGVTNTAAAAA